MTGWMLETLAWTAVLIVFVLLVRRPVSRHFGPQIAYALWALPALRLFLPPIELPAWMRWSEPALQPDAAQANAAQANAAQANAAQANAAQAAGPLDASQLAPPSEESATVPMNAAASVAREAPSFDWSVLVAPALAVWLIGAGVFLIMRFAAYFRLRADLLEEARLMGRSGKVRLIETPATNSPLAFGVIDKVVALPQGFLAQPDRHLRDLALEHELQHHKAHDLLVNILVQPLFAIHWWNPLGRYGWLALRRDQEAACDARVMAARVMANAPDETREIYANLIVSFAAGSNAAPSHALTAPMACPVLGDKSIIHRLRSLKMDTPKPPRRLAGKALLGAAVIALPLTASISYAATQLPVTIVAPPVAPEAPEAFGVTADMPTPPAPPAPPAPPRVAMVNDQIIVIDRDGETSTFSADTSGVFVIEDEGNGTDRHFIVRQNDRTTRFIDRDELTEDGQLSEEQIDDIMSEVREGLEEANKALEDLPSIIESAMADAQSALDEQGRPLVVVERGCDGSDTEVATTTELGDGRQLVKICQARIMNTALEGLKEAREELKTNDELSQKMRTRALREIDRAIDRWADTSS